MIITVIIILGCSVFLTGCLVRKTPSLLHGEIIEGQITTSEEVEMDGSESILQVVQVDRGFTSFSWWEGTRVNWIPSYFKVNIPGPIMIDEQMIHIPNRPVLTDLFGPVKTFISNRKLYLSSLLRQTITHDGAHFYQLQLAGVKYGEQVAVLVDQNMNLLATGSKEYLKKITSSVRYYFPYFLGAAFSLVGAGCLLLIERVGRTHFVRL